MNETETTERIRQALQSHKIFIFMKGSPEQPMCGFSARAVDALRRCGAVFGSLDVLQDPEVRAVLPKVANWPTFPQVYIEGELVVGVILF